MNCPNKSHYENLLIWGECPNCHKVWALGDKEDNKQENYAKTQKQQTEDTDL